MYVYYIGACYAASIYIAPLLEIVVDIICLYVTTTPSIGVKPLRFNSVSRFHISLAI